MEGLEEDPKELLVHVPFATFDLDQLAHPSLSVSLGRECLPGGIHDESRPPRSSTPRFPQEIALRVLSSAHYHVRMLRIVFRPTKRPRQLDVQIAVKPPVLSRSVSMDIVSQYFSAEFEPVGESIVWPPESALSWPLPPTEIIIPLTRRDSSPIVFIKLVMYEYDVYPNNNDHQTIFSQLELLGVFRLPSREIPLNSDELICRQENPQSADYAATGSNNLIRESLENAGLPEALINELIEVADETSALEGPENAENIAKKTTSIRNLDVGGRTEENLLDSPFDQAMREFVERQFHQEQLLASTEMPQHDVTPSQTLNHSFSLPRIVTRDQNHYDAIATHTFGSFFTQCIADSSFRVESLRLAERLAPLLLRAELAIELVYEGLLAVVVLALKSETIPSLDAFHAALHLTRTIFQDRLNGFQLINTLSIGQINIGLAVVLESVLQCSYCWSLGVYTAVDRELLKTMRLLITQKSTRPSFLRAIQEPVINQEQLDDLLPLLNRLRVLRWVLQRHFDKLTTSDHITMRSFIEKLATDTSPNHEKRYKIVQQCLRILNEASRPKASDLDAQLFVLRNHIQEHDHQNDEHHIPLFEAFPLTETQQDKLVLQLQRYFHLHKRPLALYRHVFTAVSLEGHIPEKEFRKGNVVFRGLAQARIVPNSSFHSQVERCIKPFEFSTSTKLTTTEHSVGTMETSFAQFQGTIEPRAVLEPTSHVKNTMSPTYGQASVSPLPPVAARSPSNSKFNRVVPVVETSHVEMTVSPIKSPRLAQAISPAQQLPTEPEVSATPLVRSVSTALPVVRTLDTTDKIPSKPPIPTTTPKTAPVGKSSKSQDAGCGIQ